MREFEADEQMVKQEVEPSSQSQIDPRPAHESTLLAILDFKDMTTSDVAAILWEETGSNNIRINGRLELRFAQEEKPERMLQCDNCLTIVPASEIETVAVYSDGIEGDFCERCRGGE